MKIMKLLASCAMVGALTAVCASGAFANGTQWAILSKDKATLTINVPASYVKSVTGDDLTVLVLNEDATSVENTDILQIDQVSKNNATITLAMPENFDTTEGKKSADGTYYVRVGGAAVSTSNPKGYISTEFKVGSTEKPTPAVTATVLGDYTGDKTAAGNDDEADKTVAILGTPAAKADATSLVWTVTSKEDKTQEFTQSVDVSGEATYKFGLVLRNITADLIKTVSAVLQ